MTNIFKVPSIFLDFSQFFSTFFLIFYHFDENKNSQIWGWTLFLILFCLFSTSVTDKTLSYVHQSTSLSIQHGQLKRVHSLNRSWTAKNNLTHFISEMIFSLENFLLNALLIGFLLLLNNRITLECNKDSIFNRYIYVQKKYRLEFNRFFNQ